MAVDNIFFAVREEESRNLFMKEGTENEELRSSPGRIIPLDRDASRHSDIRV
jgi:hypothetical protein